MNLASSIEKGRAGVIVRHHRTIDDNGTNVTFVVGYDRPTTSYFLYIEQRRRVVWSSLDHDGHGDQTAMLNAFDKSLPMSNFVKEGAGASPAYISGPMPAGGPTTIVRQLFLLLDSELPSWESAQGDSV